MADGSPLADADALEAWAVSTFDVVVFGLTGVLVAHASDVLSGALAGLGTLEGVAVFGYLWVLTFLAVRWALAEGGLARTDEGALHTLVIRGAVAGALVGAGFLLGVILAVAVVNVASGAWALRGDGVLPFVFVALLGGSLAAVVGAFVGAVFVLVDASLYRLSNRLVAPPQS